MGNNKSRINWEKEGIKDKLMADQNGKCAACDKPMLANGIREDYPTIEHVIEISKGGADAPDNIVLTCRGCNEASVLQKKAWNARATTPVSVDHCARAVSIKGNVDDIPLDDIVKIVLGAAGVKYHED